ncbi:hypothetical protein ABOM_001551 [Aspergillus bombycis]|uniref:Uncharacterized protein n=1 Tax=Aspergillus bombycis TaxID=109264 RepID=A0A1F8ADM3_9EURO|nr:hypothetical protein ABOM_001551 [Aspergillus bombycis]OGM49782.1 hypothetical protein ABOM_001551 [Aspergillus bombycis]
MSTVATGRWPAFKLGPAYQQIVIPRFVKTGRNGSKSKSRLRLFYCSWVLDCQHNWFWALPITIPIEFLQFPMPSHESTWNASSSVEWQHSLRNDPGSHPSAPLRERPSEPHRTRSPLQLGAFNTLLLAMGVYCDAPRLRHTILYMDLLRQYAEILPPTNLTRVALDHIHLASIFLYIPARELFAFSGWQVSAAQQAKIATKLEKWMHNQSEALVELQHRHDSKESDYMPTVRLDRGSTDVTVWATSTAVKRLYLGGVGCLWDGTAIERLLRVTAGILEGGMAWPQAQVAAPALGQHYYSWQHMRQKTAVPGQP